MNAFRFLQFRLEAINAKLDSKSNSNLINSNYHKDVKKINKLFDLSKQEAYKNGLNKCRDELLAQIINKRDQQLKQVDENKPKNSLNQLKNLSNTLKYNFLIFSSGIISINESIRRRAKLETRFNFFKLVNYSKFVCYQKSFSIKSINKLYNYDWFVKNFIVSSNLVFLAFHICIDELNYTFMLTMDQNGDLVHTKKLNYPSLSTHSCFIETNSTNIVVHYDNDKVVEVYSFGLELINSIKLDKTYLFLLLNDYDIGLFDKYERVLTMYNFKARVLSKKVTNVNKYLACANPEFLDSKFFYDLVSFNERFFIFNHNFNSTSFYYVLGRKDFSFLYKFVIGFNSYLCIHDSEFYLLEYKEDKVKIFKTSENNMDELGIVENDIGFEPIIHRFSQIELGNFFNNEQDNDGDHNSFICIKNVLF